MATLSGQPGAKRTEPAVWLLFLGVLYTLYFTQSLLMPLVVTSLIALLLSPLVAALQGLHVPRTVSAFLLVSTLIAPFTFLGAELAEPAQKWAKLVPELTQHVTEQLDSISDAMEGENESNVPAKTDDDEFSFFGLFKNKAEQGPVEKDENVMSQRLKQGG